MSGRNPSGITNRGVHLRGNIRQRLIQGSVAAATSAIMLGAFVGLSAAAPPAGHGASESSHAEASHGHANSGSANENTAGSHSNAGGANDAASSDGAAEQGRGQSGPDTDGTRPGWGCGDPNHVHTGPPGGGAGFDPCTIHVVTRTRTLVTGTETETITETLTGTETETTTETGTTTTSSNT